MRAERHRGYSLIEMLIVVGLLALIAGITIPAMQMNDGRALDRAAEEVEGALRLAHAEALRTGQSYGVIADMSGQWIRVYRLDETASPPVPVYDVRDPITKQIVDLQFSGDSEPAISKIYFKFSGYWVVQTFVAFSGSTGVPRFNNAGTIQMLEQGYIRLIHDGETRTIAVSPMTGRVTVQ